MFAQIDASTHMPFKWGVNDCCQFVARVVDAMTESNLVAQLTYGNEDGALSCLYGHGSLEKAVTSFLGEPVADRATRGDVVLFQGGEGDSVGICIGNQIVGVGPEGLRRVPRSEIRTVWKV
jgi:hypothetical protein